MAAVIVIKELNGATPDLTTVSDILYGCLDQVNPLQRGTPDDYAPVPIPSSAQNYSFWKSHCLDLSSTFDDIRNFRVYFTDPSWTLGTGGTKTIGNKDSGDIGCLNADYEQAGGTPYVTGYAIADLTHGHSFYNGETVKTKTWSQWTSGTPGVFDAGAYISADQTKHVVTQVSIGVGAAGVRNTGGQMTFRFQQVD